MQLGHIFPHVESLKHILNQSTGPLRQEAPSVRLGTTPCSPVSSAPSTGPGAEQGPVNTCPCLEAFPRDGALTQARFLTHSGQESQAHTSSRGEDITYLPPFSLLAPPWPESFFTLWDLCLVLFWGSGGLSFRSPTTSGADDWTAASPALPLNKAPDNTSSKQPHS